MDEITSLIRELEFSLLRPEGRSSTKFLGRLIADDFVEFGASGRIYDKANVLECLPKETGILFEASGFEARMLSENVVLTTFTLEKTLDTGERSRSLRSSIWRNTDGSWQMVFHQGTPTD